MEEKQNNSSSILIILLGIILGVSAYFLVNNQSIKKEKNVEEKNKIEEKTTKEVIKPLDLTKSINTTNITYQNQKDLDSSNDSIKLKINKNKKSITITINWDKLVIENDYLKEKYKGIESYQVEGFEKNIKSAYIGVLGDNYSGTTLFYLMDDNTVEYTSLYTPKTNMDNITFYDINFSGENFSNHLIVPEIEKVYKINSVTATSNNKTYNSVIAILKDGSFYDLDPVINR